jgi:hypothetical protein
VRRTVHCGRRSGSPYEAAHERNEKQNQEDEEKDFCDSRSGYGNAKKAEYRGNQSHDEKYQSPTQHESSL